MAGQTQVGGIASESLLEGQGGSQVGGIASEALLYDKAGTQVGGIASEVLLVEAAACTDPNLVVKDSWDDIALGLFPVAYWPLSHCDNALYRGDLTGSGHDLTPSGNAERGTLSNGFQGATLDGAAYLYADDASDLRPENGRGGWAISFWAQSGDWSVEAWLLGKWKEGGSNDHGWAYANNSSNQFYADHCDGQTAGCDSVMATGGMPVDAATHVVLSFDDEAEEWSVYKDGVLSQTVALENVDGADTSGVPFTIGTRDAATGNKFDGEFAKIAYFDKTLTAPQVYELFTGIAGDEANSGAVRHTVIAPVTRQKSLGQGTYEIYVAERGGKVLLGRLTEISQGSWERKRDDVSSARVIVERPSDTCRDILSQVRAARHELVFFRNGQRVWEGPIVRPVFSKNEMELYADDVLWYADRLPVPIGWDNSTTSVNGVELMDRMLRATFDPHKGTPYDFNVSPFISPQYGGHDPKTSELFPAYSKTALEVLENYAQSRGVDYTVIGRRVLIFDTHLVGHEWPRMTDEHFDAGVVFYESASSLTVDRMSTDGKGNQVTAQGPDEWRDYYGPLTKLITLDGEDPLSDPNAVRERGVGDYPAPITLRLPDNTGLRPDVPLDMDDLIPGARVPLRSTETCRDVEQMQKLDKVKVVFNRNGESVSVTLDQAPAKVSRPVGYNPTPPGPPE